MKGDVYHLVTITDGKTDNAAIVETLSRIAEGKLKNDLVFLNYYNEVPVSYAASITSVEDDSVEFHVHEHQAVIMKNDNNTLIKSKHFKDNLGVHCYAAYVNIPKKRAILHNFAYAQIRAERREAVRVSVQGNLQVTFSSEDMTIAGAMVDISGTGISFTSTTFPELKSDQQGTVSFTLTGTPLTIPGAFVRSFSRDDEKHAYIIQIRPDRISDSCISKYIYQRQVEIIQELKEGIVDR